MQNLKLLTLVTLLASFSAFSQIKTPAASPTATLMQEVGITNITINYSRPGIKDRVVFGELVKYDELWRTGANGATKISFDGDVKLGGLDLKAGDYVILTKPGKVDWTVNVYDFDKAGVGGYFSKEPIGSFTVKPKTVANSVETFTIDINNITNSTATIDLIWEKTIVSLPLDVKTSEKVMAAIDAYDKNSDSQMANDYHGMASYLLSENKDLEKALAFESKAVEIRPDAFWMLRVKSEIEAALGKYDDAIATAKLSMASAEKAGNQQYVAMNEANIKAWKKKK